MIKIYISGPITGMPDNNRKAFKEMYGLIAAIKRASTADCFREMKIINPSNIGARVDRRFSNCVKKPEWVDYMRPCIEELAGSTHVVFLKNWERSEGATLERYIAKRLGISCADGIEELAAQLKAYWRGEA